MGQQAQGSAEHKPILPSPRPHSPHLAVPPQPHHSLVRWGEIGWVEGHGAVHGAIVGDAAEVRAEKPHWVGQAQPGPPALPALLPTGTSAHPSRSCRCTQVGSRGVAALEAQTPRSPSCSAERCQVGTCIPMSQSSSAVGPAAGRGEKGELRPPAQRSSTGCASWAFICTWPWHPRHHPCSPALGQSCHSPHGQCQGRRSGCSTRQQRACR